MEVTLNGIDFLDRGWELDPDQPCLVDGVSGLSSTYAQVRAESFRIGRAYRQNDYAVGAKVSVLSGNSIEGFIAVLGAMRAGLTHIPVNARNTAAHNSEILDRFDCDLLLFTQEFAAIVTEIRASSGRGRRYVCIGGDLEGCESLIAFSEGCGSEPFDLWHDAERAYEILPTSATTGFPKGVVWPNRQLESIVANVMSAAPCVGRPVFLAVAPLTHLAGKFMHYVFCMGGTGVVLPTADRPAILRAISQFRVTHIFLPPTVIYDLLNEPAARTADYSSLQYLIYSAAPMAPDKITEAIALFGPVLCQIWGQSEAAWCTILSPSDHVEAGGPASARRLASCGRPLPFVRVAVMDDEGRLLADGEKGELVVRGNNVMTEYYRNPEETAEAGQFGWHHTGDIGFRDKDGYFYIVDRKKDMIISGGFNIYSAEVETEILAHPAVLQCAVIGVPDERWGEAVKAVVELKPGTEATVADIMRFARERLGGMKAPKSIDVVEQLPRSPIGKILKREVREWYWRGRDRKVS